MDGRIFPGAFGLLLLGMLCAGCLSSGIGDVKYSQETVLVSIDHAGEPANVTIQVTAYRIDGIRQEPYAVFAAPATLEAGQNTVSVPARLEPGSYKLYVYILGNGDRKSAVIRDIVV